MSVLWDLSTLDGVFTVMFVMTGVIFLAYFFAWVTVGTRLSRHARWRVLRRKRGSALGAIVGFAAILGVWLAYGSVRNQLRTDAENATNDVSTMFAEWEREKPFIRCLYGWYSNIVDANECRQLIVGSRDNFSESLLYVEEVLLHLKQSRRSQEVYRSPYFADIDYWRQDIREDPTGLFSFYLVSEHGSAGARVAAQEAGVCIPDLCLGYEQVRAALFRRGFSVDSPNACRAGRNRLRLPMACEGL